MTYDSFGNILEDTNPTFTMPFGFAGGLHDRDTGLVRFGYRDYNPEVGRWTAKDPILFARWDLDLYRYCINDPINLGDPDGQVWGSAFRWLAKQTIKQIGKWFGKEIGDSEIAYPPEEREMAKDTDGDGTNDYYDDDDDDDGIPDEVDEEPKIANLGNAERCK
jgi:RHS repeat-associated protein